MRNSLDNDVWECQVPDGFELAPFDGCTLVAEASELLPLELRSPVTDGRSSSRGCPCTAFIVAFEQRRCKTAISSAVSYDPPEPSRRILLVIVDDKKYRMLALALSASSAGDRGVRSGSAVVLFPVLTPLILPHAMRLQILLDEAATAYTTPTRVA